MTVDQKTKIQECIDREYRFYNEIVPYIDLVEVYFGAIKDGMLNDIRKFMGHIAGKIFSVAGWVISIALSIFLFFAEK